MVIKASTPSATDYEDPWGNGSGGYDGPPIPQGWPAPVIRVPVGPRIIPVQLPRVSLPKVVPRILVPAQNPDIRTTVRKPEPPNKTNVPRGPTEVTYVDYLAKNPPGSARWLPADIWTTMGSSIRVPTAKPQGEKPMDLGNLVTDLLGGYINAKYAPRAPTPVMGPQPFTPATTPVWNPLTAFADDDGGDSLFGGTTTCKPKRRRRRRKLATLTDIRDLASLKAILSPAELKTWIATHPN